MSGLREKDDADYDLERFTEMFDQAMTSTDPRVKNALRQLMMMVILTDTSSDHEAEAKVRGGGPLRRIQEDVRDQFRWIKRLESELETLKKHYYNEMQRQGNNTALQGAKVSGGYPDVQTEQSQSSRDYWNSVIAQTNQQKEIKNYASALNNLNIKVAQDTGEK